MGPNLIIRLSNITDFDCAVFFKLFLQAKSSHLIRNPCIQEFLVRTKKGFHSGFTHVQVHSTGSLCSGSLYFMSIIYHYIIDLQSFSKILQMLLHLNSLLRILEQYVTDSMSSQQHTKEL